MFRILISFFLILFFALHVRSAHIVGGDLYYECLGNNNYRITLKIYRDCFSFGPNVAWFDEPAHIAIYDVNRSQITVQDVYLTFGPDTIPPETRDPCLQAPANICVEEGIYQFTINLPPRTGGYDIVYVRCCRNATIQNIFDPGGTGATYIAHIPDPGIAACNSNPVFVNFPPIVICANAPINFDHRAVDANGDQLVYSLCAPVSGADVDDPKPYPPFFFTPPGDVSWRPPFSAGNPMGGSPPLSINPQTGFLTGVPTQLGQYVVGVCVSEYRNGVLIGVTRRDFQFNVVQCATDVQAIVPVVDTFGAAATQTAGVFAYQCQGLFVQFINNSINGSYYRWDFGDLTTNADTSNLFEPFYVYPDSGVYKVQLIVNPGFNCADTTSVLVKIYPTFEADFTFVSGCSDKPVVFTDQSATTYGAIDSWAWDFGDGIIGIDQNPNHLYLNGGTYTVTLYATNDKGCSDSRTKTVLVHPFPRANFSFTPTCINTPVTFTDLTTISSGSFTRTWLFDANVTGTAPTFTQTFTNLTSFAVTLITVSDIGCADTITEIITVHPLPVAVVRPDTAICLGDSVRLDASGGIAYQWNPSNGLNATNIAAPMAKPAATTNYTVTVTDINSCSNTASVNITVHPLPATSAGNDATICFGDSIQLNGSGELNLSWSPGEWLSDSTDANPVAYPPDTTTFVLISYNNFGCFKRDSVIIAVQLPISINLPDEEDMCEGDSITLSANGGLYYLWMPEGGLPDNASADYTVFPTETTTYSVRVSNDCFDTTGYVTVTIRPLPEVDAGEDLLMVRDEFVMLNGTATGINNYWTPPDGLDFPDAPVTRASPLNTTIYRLNSESEYGCKAWDEMTISVEIINLIAIPSAFSPNNDGANDIFRIIKTLNIESIYFFKVFNRWGQIVFETTDMRRGWDGTVFGEPQEIGVYAYIVKALNRDGEVIIKEGSVTLVR